MGCLCDNTNTGRKNPKRGNQGTKTNNKSNKNNEKDKIVFKSIDIMKKRKIIIDNKKLENLIDEEKKKFNENALKLNNKYRKQHGINPLDFDDYLYKRAFILAKQYLTDGTFDNKNLLYEDGGDLGMNALISDEELNPKNLMKKWYEENKNYNYIVPKELESNNFTQMIWKNSKKFGIGYFYLLENEDYSNKKYISLNKDNVNENKTSERKKFYYVALYYPAGNIPGEYEDNVLKPLENEADKKEFNKKSLAKNNEYRKEHEVDPLELDDNLSKRAFTIAKEYLSEKKINDKNLLNEEGEKFGMNTLSHEKKLEPEDLMKLWYDEKLKYDYKEPKKSEGNNFTQMIWKSSKKFGIGYYNLSDDEDDEEETGKSINKDKKDDTNNQDNQIISKETIKENNKPDGVTKSKRFYYIALYYPSGNIKGEFEQNVFKSIQDKNREINQKKGENSDKNVEPQKTSEEVKEGNDKNILIDSNNNINEQNDSKNNIGEQNKADDKNKKNNEQVQKHDEYNKSEMDISYDKNRKN